MINDIWVNLPVKDVKKAREFFIALGLPVDERFDGGQESAAIRIPERNLVVMLFKHDRFNFFAGGDSLDVSKGGEVMFSLGAKSRADVDELAARAEKAGGNVFSKPAEIQGWMYGCAFSDLDGHRWNALYMDMSKMTK